MAYMNIILSLPAAVQQLYSAFSEYSFHENMEGCPCCVYENDHKHIRRTQLRLLLPDDVTKYAYKALTTWGTLNDFKYLLPRLFELQSYEPFIDTEILFGKLEYAGWNQWPSQEREAVHQFFVSYWHSILHGEFEEPRTASEEALCGIAQAEEDLSDYLALWTTPVYTKPLYHLKIYIRWNWNGLSNYKLSNPFWDKRTVQQKQIIDWLTSVDLIHRLEDEALLTQSEDIFEILSEIVETVRQLRSILNAAG